MFDAWRYEDSLKQVKTSDATTPGSSSVTSATNSNVVGGTVPSGSAAGVAGTSTAIASLPADLKILCRLEASTSKTGICPFFDYIKLCLFFIGTPNVELCIQASLDTALIRTVAIFAEHVFEEESFVVHPNQPTNNLRILLTPNKHVSANMLVKVLVSQRGSTQCQVFELVQVIPFYDIFSYSSHVLFRNFQSLLLM
jgi:hypothetical protein